MSNSYFFEPLRIKKNFVGCVNVCVLLGMVSWSQQDIFEKMKSPLLSFQSVSLGFLKALELECLAFHFVSVNQKPVTRFQTLTRKKTHAQSHTYACLCVLGVINNLTNYKPAHCSLRCCCRSFISGVLLRRSYTFQWLFLLHFFLFHFHVTFPITQL